METLKGIVTASLDAAWKKAEQKSDDGREDVLRKAFEDLERKEGSRGRSPRHLVQKAISNLEIACKDPESDSAPHITQHQFDEKLDRERRLSIYREFVQTHCRVLWKAAVDAKGKEGNSDEEGRGVAAASHGSQTKEPEIRVCDISLNRILRKDFDEDAAENVCEILDEKQRLMSNHIDEIQVAVLSAHIEVVTCYYC